MKKKDLAHIRSQTVPELEKLAGELRVQITKAKMELAMHKSKNTNIVKNLRRDLGRILSLKREMELVTKV